MEPLRTHHERQGRTAPGVVRTQGSLYVFAKLPEGVDDMAAIKYLSHQHKVCVLPGKGAHVRVCVCDGVLWCACVRACVHGACAVMCVCVRWCVCGGVCGLMILHALQALGRRDTCACPSAICRRRCASKPRSASSRAFRTSSTANFRFEPRKESPRPAFVGQSPPPPSHTRLTRYR